MEKLEELLEWGGIKRDIVFLILWDFCWSRVNGNNECFFMRCMQM